MTSGLEEPGTECRRGQTGAGWVRPVDCQIGMRDLDDRSVSLILTDPPYFIDGMDDKWDHDRLRSRVRAGVVGGIPAGMKFHPDQGKRLYRFMQPVAVEWKRIIRPGGFALCFAQPRLAHRATLAMEEAGFEIRDMLAWRYEGQAKAFTQEHFVRKRKIPEADKQAIIKALDGRKTPQLKPQMELIILAQAPREGTFVDNWMKYRVGLIDVKSPLIEPDRFPGTVIPVSKPRRRFGHITAKPVELLRHLIRIFCGGGDDALVLDPFAGSGSTGVAARAERKAFLGFEIDQQMAEAANGRIADCLNPESPQGGV